MSEKIDIYGNEIKHKRLVEKLENGLKEAQNGQISLYNQQSKKNEVMSVRNAELLLGFDTASGLQKLSKCRRIKYLMVGKQLILQADKDFDKLTQEDIHKIVLWIEDKKNVYTKQMFNVILKKFVKYCTDTKDYLKPKDKGKEYPELVSWIKVNIPKKERPQVARENILTEQEIMRGIQSAEDTKEKAIFALQSETGCRIGELANMRIKDFIREKINPESDDSEYFVRLNGKTGERVVIIFYSAPFVLDWLNKHPARSNLESPFWTINSLKNEVRPMNYPAFKEVIKQVYKKAGINKPARTHYLRHSRYTIDERQGLNDGIAKKRFGWCPETRQIATYSHLIDEDTHDYYREKHKKGKRVITEPLLTIKKCYKCGHENRITNDFCEKCRAIINIEFAEKLRSETAAQMNNRLMALEQMLAQISRNLQQPQQIITPNGQAWISASGTQWNDGKFTPHS